MVYLSTSLAVVVAVVDFTLFGASEYLIKNSQRLLFCNSGRLQEKIQDNISKRAAVQKTRSTLGKDKEDGNII